MGDDAGHGHVQGHGHVDPRFAIALEYDGNQAPVVTAKGHREVAEEILSIAEQENIPVYEDRELSALLEQLDLGEHIPPSLYLVIAEVLSWIFIVAGSIFVLIGGVGLFAALAIVVTIGGALDIRKLFRALREQHEAGENATEE